MTSSSLLYTLRIQCQDQPGIVAAVAAALSNNECNIEESAQFHDPESEQFFMRVVFTTPRDTNAQKLKDSFQNIARRFAMTWHLNPASEPVKTLILVSQHDHCLNNLLYRWKSNHLPIEITAIASNHENTRALVEHYDLPFHYLPVTSDTKEAQENQIRALIDETQAELIVLARYMQILSEDFCTDFKERIINIHHSFLPGFKGARPYHQAYQRGVKIIGSTAHYVTSDLDEGPIISQGIIPVDHTHTPEKMQRLGQDSESRVLAQAIQQYGERRIFCFDERTIIL
ncbi:MAG: formyltetrahydrofolate deformylase [Alphaproteobacteria bacterium]|nr:formyltetrahydrofolate deformylase [Alphaproteobacteria bacterium]